MIHLNMELLLGHNTFIFHLIGKHIEECQEGITQGVQVAPKVEQAKEENIGKTKSKKTSTPWTFSEEGMGG